MEAWVFVWESLVGHREGVRGVRGSNLGDQPAEEPVNRPLGVEGHYGGHGAEVKTVRSFHEVVPQ